MKKITIILSIVIILLGITTTSYGFDLYKEDAEGAIKSAHFYPTYLQGNQLFFCIQAGGEFNPGNNMLTRTENANYPAGRLFPSNGSYVCEGCDHGSLEDELPWDNNTKYFYRYSVDSKLSPLSYQDAAYVLAEMTEREGKEEGNLISWDTAYGIWNSSISRPGRSGDYQIEGESIAYKSFFEATHSGTTDIFETLIIDNSDNVKIGVNQSNNTYTVGPFKIDYPDGVYDGKNKFSWIESIEAVTDVGTLPIQIFVGATQINIDDLKENGIETLDNKSFYIRFTSQEASNVKLRVKFGYLEHCDAEMTKYTGQKIYRNFAWQYGGQHDHGWPYPIWDVGDANGDGIIGAGELIQVGEGWHPDMKDKRRYETVNNPGSATQVLMALSGKASKVRKTVEKEFSVSIITPPPTVNPPTVNPPTTNPPDSRPPIDLTMKIAGTVFLDQDTGKVNAGNNKLDSEEGLPGVEVYLRQVGGGEVGRTLTDKNGNYSFTGINSQHYYYIEFVYNGMLYTNVERLLGNANDISKATEDVNQYPNTRQNFNNQFAQIGSNPQNYKIKNKVFGNELGDYNKVYLQEEVADLFKQVAEKFGDVSDWKDADIETKRKVQFVVDCRITAYSSVYNESQKTYQIQTYPLIDVFTVDSSWNHMAGQSYDPLYVGAYSQLHVNLGIKARPTFDLALYKDVFNATININGKKEVYTYDARKDWRNEGFSFGVNEADYLNQLRAKYISGTDTTLQTKEVTNEGQYVHELRTEEIINGNNQHTAINVTDIYGENKNYAWRDINHSLSDADKLQIHVTYKLAIRNQSNVVGSVTEIVDYYDSHYQFENAYVGDKNGNQIQGTTVDASETSMYGANTQNLANGQWTVGNGSSSYKTIYLRPTEKKLYSGDKEQYIYITFGLINPEATLVAAGLPSGGKLYTYNLAEINGYKTYGTDIKDTDSMGLVDRDSNPGNLNPSTYVIGKTALEDDESKAPAYVYSHRNSRTLEGTVFEDMLENQATASKDENEVKVDTTRFGNGTIDNSDRKIKGIKVELVEIKNGELISRQTTYTDENGWYGFGAFLPGDYTIRFTYGGDDKTALTNTSQYAQGYNATSYNGQDYQSTKFETKIGETASPHTYKVDSTLSNIYNENNQAKNNEETIVNVADQIITKYETDGYYWYDDVAIVNKSDARDDAYRRNLVTAYSKSEYGKEITNHKAEVFNSYINQNTLREEEAKDKNFNEFTQAKPMDKAVDTQSKNRELVNELERRTYMYAYTPEIEVEVEYTTEQIAGNMSSDKYTYKITGVDFGVVERPRAQLTIDQDVKHIKVTASDGNVLFNTENGVNNLQWIAKGDTSKYDKNELINIILDDELLSGSKVEVTYNITVTNNSEAATGTTRAKTIINYVANNLNFDLADNNGLWEAVKKEDIQTTSRSTYINNSVNKNNEKLVDLSTQTTVLKATSVNPLIKALNPGESATATLTLKKTLSAESSSDDLSYSNLTEIVEIENTIGRYDHGAIPGNQSLQQQPREHDTSGASRYDETDSSSGTKNVKTRYIQDGKIIVTPPTGSKMIYYVLGMAAMFILAVGIILIKKFVIRKK